MKTVDPFTKILMKKVKDYFKNTSDEQIRKDILSVERKMKRDAKRPK